MENLKIKEARENKNLEQKEVAHILKCKQQQISRMEIDEPPIYIHRLIELAYLYDTSIDYMLGLTDIKKPYPRTIKKER